MWNKEELEEVVKRSTNKSDVLRNMGLNIAGGNFNTLNKYLKMWDISTEHFCRPAPSGGHIEMELEDMLVEHSTTNRRTVKNRLLKEKLLIYECNNCGISEWDGKDISLHLDHINGICDDNRVENLRLLCPNCHSQTPTYGGKNVKDRIAKIKCTECDNTVSRDNKSGKCYDCYLKRGKSVKLKKYGTVKNTKECKCGNTIQVTSSMCIPCYKVENASNIKPPKDQLIEDLATMTWTNVGKKYGVSDNSVRKWAVGYGIGKDRKKIKETYESRLTTSEKEL
jgi:5-methylcytosine-specific restriction endonuclease McrA